MYESLLRDLSEIEPEMARHVLAHFGDSHGHRAGSFTMQLISTIAAADIVNIALLATAYPGYAQAVALAKNRLDGMQRLREIARGDLPGPEVVKGRWFPEMPPVLPGEDAAAYTDRLTGADRTNRVPYDHRRFRQCSIGWHLECSDPRGEECECPCHEKAHES